MAIDPNFISLPSTIINKVIHLLCEFKKASNHVFEVQSQKHAVPQLTDSE